MNTVMGKTLAYDLGYIAAGLEELEAYLLSKELFWPVNAPSPAGEGAYPQLTLGGLLLALRRARSRGKSPPGHSQVQRLETHLNAARAQWLSAWEEKAAWELRSRMRQWGSYLTELRREPADHRVYFRYEVRLRALIELLIAEVHQLESEDQALLTMLDQEVRGRLIAGDFVWGEDLAEGFPKDTFWYLWGDV